MKYIYFGVVCLLACFQQCITGFGFAIMSMPLLTLIFPIKTITPVVALASFIAASQNAFKFRKHIDFKIAIAPIITIFIGRTIGVSLLMTVNEKVLKPILGIILILITIYFIFFKDKGRIKPNITNGLIVGLVSGVLGGLFNTGGPPIVVYYLFALNDKLSYLATCQFTFLVGNLYSIFLHILHGNFKFSFLYLSIISFFAVSLGGYLGRKVAVKVKNINYPIYVFMALMGILLIVESAIH